MRYLLLLLFVAVLNAEEQTEQPPPHMLMAQRLMASLPNLPNVIQNQMAGKPDDLKKMVSSVLGDGLISQLVVNPVGVAEEMGVSMDSLGLNKTILERLNNATNGMAGKFLEPNPAQIENKSSIFGDLPNLFTTPKPVVTTTVMYVDGVPIDDFDAFIRKHNPRDAKGRPLFNTSKPPPPTTPLPSAQEIAENVLKALKKNAGTEAPLYPKMDSGIDLSQIDPARQLEVSNLIRRAPAKNFDTLSGMPSPDSPIMPIVPLDPQIDGVLTTLRTKSFGGLTVEEVKQLQGALQQYEQTLQTKELFAKRKQLQVLQTELLEQKKRIEDQRRMEEELRKKEKELEEKRIEMEKQLRQQLNSWHSSFNNHPPGSLTPIDMPSNNYDFSPMGDELRPETVPLTDTLNPKHSTALEVVAPPPELGESIASSSGMMPSSSDPMPDPSLFFQSSPKFSMKPSVSSPPASFKIEESEDQLEVPEEQPSPPAYSKSSLSQLRYSPEHSQATEMFQKSAVEDQHEDEFSSNCECIQVSLEKMQGSWVHALASQSVLDKTEKTVSHLLSTSNPTSLSCSKYEFSSARSSTAAQDARVTWEFRTTNSRRKYKLSGTALSIDHMSTRVNLNDLRGKQFSMPFCVLKSSGESRYDYMVIVNSSGPCNEASLLVRDRDTFFDHHDLELVKFLKHRISQGEMDQMTVVPFANDCRT